MTRNMQSLKSRIQSSKMIIFARLPTLTTTARERSKNSRTFLIMRTPQFLRIWWLFLTTLTAALQAKQNATDDILLYFPFLFPFFSVLDYFNYFCFWISLGIYTLIFCTVFCLFIFVYISIPKNYLSIIHILWNIIILLLQ